MKKLTFSLLLMALAFGLSAQTDHPETVRLHLIHKGEQCGFRLKTTLNHTSPVKLASKSYNLLEFKEKQLGIIQEINFAEQMIYLNFEKGKDYYFRILQMPGQLPMIDELTENAFKMELLMSDIDFYPIEHKLFGDTALNN